MKRLLTARFLTAVLLAFLPPAAAQSGNTTLRLVIDENFTTGSTTGVRLQGPGKFLREGWHVPTERSQIRYDLGKFHARGVVEVVLRGPIWIDGQGQKRNAVALWNEEAGGDGDRKTQRFFQLRFREGGMMLRLSNRAGAAGASKGRPVLSHGSRLAGIRFVANGTPPAARTTCGVTACP